MVATGKARGPWTENVLPFLPQMPAVFLQGLLVYNTEGSLIYEDALEPQVIRGSVALAAEFDLTLTAYCGERILSERIDEHTDRLLFYEEPTPEGVQRHSFVLTLLSCAHVWQNTQCADSWPRTAPGRSKLLGILGDLPTFSCCQTVPVRRCSDKMPLQTVRCSDMQQWTAC